VRAFPLMMPYSDRKAKGSLGLGIKEARSQSRLRLKQGVLENRAASRIEPNPVELNACGRNSTAMAPSRAAAAWNARDSSDIRHRISIRWINERRAPRRMARQLN